LRVQDALAGRLSEGMVRKLKYSAVSVINVPLGQAILAFCVYVLDWSGTEGNLLAVVLTTIPAYLLNRAWVWKRVGGHSFMSDVLPFWAMALLGLLVSTAVVAWAERTWSPEWVPNVASLAAFGVIWVMKYLVLDRLMFGREVAAVIDETLERVP